MNKFLLVSALAVCFAAGTGTAGAEVYKWTDADGRVHYGDQRVQGSKQVKIRTSPSDLAREADAGAGEEDGASKLDASKCASAKQQLDTYSRATQIMQRKADGTEAALSDAERSELISEAQARVKGYCG